MPSLTKASKGTLLKIGDGGGTEVFTTIAEVKDFKVPGESMGTVEVTNHDSVASEFIANKVLTIKEITASLNFIGSNAQHQQLRTDMRAGTLRNFKVVLNDKTAEADRTTVSFAAIITDFDGPEAPVAGSYAASITLKPSGLSTIAYAAA